MRIKDIALKLGLSNTLVSLVLNSKGDIHGIKKQTQEKVFRTARLMGYFKQGEEDSSQEGNRNPDMVGMIVPSMTDPFIFEISHYLEEALASINVTFSVITRDPGDMRFDELITKIRKIYSGLILVGEAADENTIRYLKRKDHPFILLEKNITSLQVNSVVSDIKAGYSFIADHINKLGYKNLTFIHSNISSSHKAFDQFSKAIAEKCMNSVINESHFSFNSRDEEIDMDQLIILTRPPVSSQLLVINESSLVYPVMKALNRININIPRDVALVSLEDGPGFDHLAVPVTRLCKNLRDIANKASGMLWSEVKNAGRGKYKRHVTIKPELLIRRSCGTLNKPDEN